MILKPSPVRKSRASLGAALRALMVSACALSAPTALAHQGPHRRDAPSRSPATHPYLAILAPTPLRFLPAERPPALLKIEPTPEEIAAAEQAAKDEAATQAADTLIQDVAADLHYNFDFPTTTELDAAIAELDAEKEAEAAKVEDQGPPPIILNEEFAPGARPEDVMPFFRLPSNPSKASYRKE